METLFEWLVQHADHAYLIIFWLLVLAGCSLPVSEDLVLLMSGVLASTVIPDQTWHLLGAAFLGSFVSDCLAYGIGRYFGDKLRTKRRFLRLVHPKRVQQMRTFYERYGCRALVVGRCIPFGLRNAIFMVAGAGRMQFGKFLLADGIACFVFSSLLFWLAYSCGHNYAVLSHYVQRGSIVLFGVMVAAAAGWLFVRRFKKSKLPSTPPA